MRESESTSSRQIIICYGIKFDEDYKFPWDKAPYDGDIDDWWLSVIGWNSDNSLENPYTSGFSEYDPRIYQWLKSRSSWLKMHPCPVSLVNYCFGDFPIYILALSGSEIIANLGEPTEFRPWELENSSGPSGEEIIKFCNKYKIELNDGPKWYLSSYWGEGKVE